MAAVDRSAIGRRNRRSGKKFETRVAKLIAGHFGWPWKEFADRAGAGHKQSHDGITLDDYQEQWPFYWECKYRDDWGLAQFFKSPATSPAFTWFREAVEGTASSLSPGLAFSKPYQPIYWLTPHEISGATAALRFTAPGLDDATGQLEGPDTDYYVYLLTEYLQGW